MEDGFYTVTYVGMVGMGLAMLLIEDGRVRGFDMIGGRYDGVCSRGAAGDLDIKATLIAQPGIQLVTGMPARDREHAVSVTATFPAAAADGSAVTVVAGGVAVKAHFQRMRGV